jgi:hypothetical protein
MKATTSLQSHLNHILHAKLWAPKIARVPTFGISRFPLGSLGTKCHLGASLVAKHKVYYKGEGGGPNFLVACLSTKSVLAMH